MKKIILICLLTIGLGSLVSCSKHTDSDENVIDEMQHEADEVQDYMEELGEDNNDEVDEIKDDVEHNH